MINHTLVNNITNITSLKKNPVELSKHKETCVLSNGKPCFYSVSPERMQELLDKEKLAHDLDLRLYTAYDCALSAIQETTDEKIKHYLDGVIESYMEDKE